MGKNGYRHKDITEKIIGAAYEVYNELGRGFLERVYHNAMLIELKNSGLQFESEKPLKVYYKEELVGDYVTDIIINECVIVELKAVKEIEPVHEVQLVNYLKATGLEVGLLINFGERIQIKRKIHTHRQKRM